MTGALLAECRDQGAGSRGQPAARIGCNRTIGRGGSGSSALADQVVGLDRASSRAARRGVRPHRAARPAATSVGERRCRDHRCDRASRRTDRSRDSPRIRRGPSRTTRWCESSPYFAFASASCDADLARRDRDREHGRVTGSELDRAYDATEMRLDDRGGHRRDRTQLGRDGAGWAGMGHASRTHSRSTGASSST